MCQFFVLSKNVGGDEEVSLKQENKSTAKLTDSARPDTAVL